MTRPKPPKSSPQQAPFAYGDYQRARTGLGRALAGPSFYALLTGASGMGKTCLFRDTVARLDRHRHHMLYLSSSKASLVGIVRFLSQKLHVSPRRSYLETADTLAEAISAQAIHLVLWVDEADQLESAILQELRILSEFSPEATQLFSVVLSGLPHLLVALDAPALFPLKRRISLSWSLNGLCRAELEPFLAHRFGSASARLPKAALDELFERTQATPALIDKVARKALEEIQEPIDPEQIRATLDAFGL
jgi:general secretion pathway protein A